MKRPKFLVTGQVEYQSPRSDSPVIPGHSPLYLTEIEDAKSAEDVVKELDTEFIEYAKMRIDTYNHFIDRLNSNMFDLPRANETIEVRELNRKYFGRYAVVETIKLEELNEALS